jgi:hypothetical protein
MNEGHFRQGRDNFIDDVNRRQFRGNAGDAYVPHNSGRSLHDRHNRGELYQVPCLILPVSAFHGSSLQQQQQQQPNPTTLTISHPSSRLLQTCTASRK